MPVTEIPPEPPLETPPVETRPLASAAAPGWVVEYAEAVGSTNAEAAARVRAGAGARLVLLTDHQTAGRGRLDRAWQTPAGVALTVSLVLDPGQPDEHWPWLPLLVGLAVVDAVRAGTGVVAGLKWPNDVLVGERKLAGILTERVTGVHGPLAVAGVGVNVHQRAPAVETATSLVVEGARVDRVVLLEALLLALDARLADWGTPGGPGRLRAAYRAECVTLGRDVVAHLPGPDELRGRAVDVDAHGQLVLEAGSRRVAVAAGDVVHLRAGET